MWLEQTSLPTTKTTTNYSPGLCFCAGAPPKAGVPLAFWEPTYLVDVTRTPYKLPGLGGISIAKADIRKRGAISHTGQSGRSSFYNVHFYNYPVLKWLSIFDEFSCIEVGDLSVAYMSEFDPFWNDDEWATVISHQKPIYSQIPVAQTACIADCVSTSLDSTSL